MDAARVLLHHFLQRYAATRDHHLSFHQTIYALPAEYIEVFERCNKFGPVPPIEYGEVFRFRNQLILAGLHNEFIRGICINPLGYATSIVIRYPLHHRYLHQVFVFLVLKNPKLSTFSS